MVKNVLRFGLTSGAVLAVIAAACAPGCGGTTSHKVASKPDASAGEAGEAGAGASAAKGGTSSSLGGGKNGGAGGKGGSAASAGDSSEAGEAGVANAGSGGALGGTGGEAGANTGGTGVGGTSVGGTSGAGTAGNGMFTEVDAGSDCIAPTDTTRLSASAVGLPTAGLTLWLRADKGVYKTADNHACAWEDQSGADTVLVALGPSGRPTWGATGLGNQAAITFPTDNTWMTVGGTLGIGATSPRTMITVSQAIDVSARWESLIQGLGNSPGTYIMTDANTYQQTDQFEAVYIMNNNYKTTLHTALAPRVHVYTIYDMTPGHPIVTDTDNPTIDYRVNGTKLALGSRLNEGLGNGNLEDFSAANFTDVGVGPGALAEAILYDRALTDVEKAKVESVLMARYGIKPVN